MKLDTRGSIRKKAVRRVVTSVAALSAAVFALAGCGNSSSASASSADSVSMSDVNAALKSDKKTTLTMWAWSEAQYKPVIEKFEKAYPNIKIKFTVSPVSTDEYTKFQNAVSSGKNIPNIIQMEYDSMPQFAVKGSLANFSSSSIEKEMGALYNDSAWKSAHVADGLYGIPTDQGPTVLYYRSDILKEHNLKAPTTWKEFEEEGIKLHKADSSKYMGFVDLADTRNLTNFLSYADSNPWTVKDVQNLSFDMQNSKVKEVATYIQRCIKEGVLKPISSASTEFNQAMNNSNYATYLDGAWRGALLKSMYPKLSGKWQVETVPTWGTATKSVSSTSGGSMLALSEATPKADRAAAIAFMNYINSNKDCVNTLVTEGGIFSATKSYQNDSTWETKTDKYFGGQAVNKVYFQAAKDVNTNWSTLPFNQEAVNEYNDIVVPTYTSGDSIFDAIGQWQTKLVKYAKDQGFTVTESK
ncbi:MAG: extracellular solute-binding protein [Bifidobacteriaceae bacterium]|nr:extracellular solute-binding protein [Bifidobacteriaceae bacterium]